MDHSPSSSSLMEADQILTVTQREQWLVESQVADIYKYYFQEIPDKARQVMFELQRHNHVAYLINGLRGLNSSFCVLDANRTWLCYWIIHSLALLGEPLECQLEDDIVDFLNRCQDPNGGYGGGPGQMPHLATTYAAVNSLITIGGDRALSSINRCKLYTFLRRMKHQSGCFRMHEEGEMDVRACYTGVSVASILNILDPELIENVGSFILSCQTYEGGIAGEPGSEAHGGYTFCGLAAMILMNEVHRLDLAALINWMVFRQGVECGFQGRTNKLVDGCYSFWQGGALDLIRRLHQVIDDQLTLFDRSGSSERKRDLGKASAWSDGSVRQQEGPQSTFDPVNLSDIGLNFVKQEVEMGPLFDFLALQQYIILCSQVIQGGLRDKPGKSRDFYHSCYSLSGLSVCQYSWSKDADSQPSPQAIFGPYENLLEPIHPLFNVVLDRYHEAEGFFSSSLPC